VSQSQQQTGEQRSSPSADQLDGLVTVLDLVRSGTARTRPQLERLSGLGRNVITQRVAQLMRHGLIEEGSLARSTGGRAPRELRLRADAGVVLVAPLGATHVAVAATDLAGRVLEEHIEAGDIAAGPEGTLARVEELFDRLVASGAVSSDLYGIGVGLPGPVEFSSGRPTSPPIMPGWDGYEVRARLAERYDVPVWVDNDGNLMALGELRAGLARGERHVIYVKVGTGIGAGLISSGRLHRGAQGCAGDIGHVAVADDSGTGILCRCGNRGCLEALAGGAALARDATTAAREGRSRYLGGLLDAGGTVTAEDVARAAQHGDASAVALLVRSGRLVGETLATLVNFFDPSLVILGGGVMDSGDLLLAAVRETVYRRSLPLATRDLRITRSPLGRKAGILGAAYMVIDELFSRERLRLWLADGAPSGRPGIAELSLG
jgi:glucokinase-like ROK family protein